MRIGMVGLGKMGGNMSQRLRSGGHEVVGYDRNPVVSDVADLAGLVDALGETPRVVWVMLPSGEPTEVAISTLAQRLGPGDVVVDGGNSNYRDSQRHGALLEERHIGFLDCGTSGGIHGLEEGYCLMVGGAAADVAVVQPVFDTLKPPEGGFAHVGEVGAGHFTKMVHNGIEYGLMQSYAEGYELLTAVDFDLDADAAFEAWRHGSVVRSWLLDLLNLALHQDHGLELLRGYAADSGEGRWTVEEAVRLAVPLPVISAALFARFASRQDDSPAMRVVAALRTQFGGHSSEAVERRPAESTTEGEGQVRPG